MPVVNVLMIEDSKDQQTLYKDALDDYNLENNDKTINLDIVESSDEAITKLNEKSYDAVLLDLLLKGDAGDGHNASGNLVLSHIINSGRIRLVVYVVSSTLHALSNDFEDLFENPLMRKFNRDEDTCLVINDLVQVLNTGVTKILGGEGKLDRLINDVFFGHLSKGFDLWVKKNRDCERELLRYVTLHLSEYLDQEDANHDSTMNYFNPEFYILPPIKNPIATGDIISVNDKRYVVLSPSCDITPRGEKDGRLIFNVDVVVLVEIIPLKKEVFEDLGISYSTSGKTNAKAWRGFASVQRGTSPKQRYHYLPQYLDVDEAVIDFKRIINLSINDILDNEKIKRIATISSPFVRDVQSRFSAYFGRQGQPSGEWSV
ncbi:hypothetical protein KOI40_02010 [Aestuariicella sp. G3-2]|uniref:hypothetical protein n=1 Tax=Pseudomaricurvus albidus TaxID=2842452 RepID=UPI001C0D6213|nr:hypothetical protein [Aestuariicella albida]MBU3068572.1 hypothetical protein [Aestuariicella albida]